MKLLAYFRFLRSQNLTEVNYLLAKLESDVPFFEPLPSTEQWLYWTLPQGQLPLISRWPKAGSNRASCYFNFIIDNVFVWTASRWWVQFTESGSVPDYTTRGWLDLLPVGPLQLFGSTGENAEGWICTLDVQYFDDIPFFGGKGVRVIETWDNAGSGRNCVLTLGFLDNVPSRWRLRQELSTATASFDFATKDGYPPFAVLTSSGGAVADCFSWPLIEGPEEGFCSCNGVDAYILFNTFFPRFTNPFKMEFEIRPTGGDEQMVVLGYTGFGSFAFMFVGYNTFQWWNKAMFLPDGLTPGVWNLVRIEYDWSIPGNAFSIWIDDVLQITSAGAFIPLVWDEIGRRGSTIEGSFDLRKITQVGGDPISPVSVIDVPLLINACAVEPPTYTGETFNMALPSCP